MTKYRHKEGPLVIKVTNSRVCLKFATEQQTDLNKMAKMNTMMLGLCARGVKESERLREEEKQERAAASTSASSQGGSGAGGGGGGGSVTREKNARKKRGRRT